LSARKFINTALSIPVFGMLYIFTALSVLLVLMFSFLNIKKMARKVTHLWACGIFVLMGKKLAVTGSGHIEKGKRYILLVNHSSIYDIPAVMCFYPDAAWFGREYLLKIPVFGRLLKVMDYVPMRDGGIGNTKRMLNSLVENSGKYTIAIFPEGTRTVTGRINRFYKGFIYVMRSVKLDILPVTLSGFYEFKPKTRFHMDFSIPLRVIVHKPFPVHEVIDKPDDEIIRLVKSQMESGLDYTDKGRHTKIIIPRIT